MAGTEGRKTGSEMEVVRKAWPLEHHGWCYSIGLKAKVGSGSVGQTPVSLMASMSHQLDCFHGLLWARHSTAR